MMKQQQLTPHLPRPLPVSSWIDGPAPWKHIAMFASGLLAVTILAGCASTRVVGRESRIGANEKLPRPDNILVYDFTATPENLPADSALASQASAPETPPTEEEAAIARQLGTGIAAQLATAIREMGLPATQVSGAGEPQLNDIEIRGYFVSVDKGSTVKRMTIGFGSGGSELTTFLEGYQMTATGLRLLGSGRIQSGSSKTPGASMGAAGWLITGNPIGLIVGGGMKIYGEASGSAKIEGRAKATAKEIAAVLKKRFKEQGWIN
jgi:hypothetical protein